MNKQITQRIDLSSGLLVGWILQVVEWDVDSVQKREITHRRNVHVANNNIHYKTTTPNRTIV